MGNMAEGKDFEAGDPSSPLDVHRLIASTTDHLQWVVNKRGSIFIGVELTEGARLTIQRAAGGVKITQKAGSDHRTGEGESGGPEGEGGVAQKCVINP